MPWPGCVLFSLICEKNITFTLNIQFTHLRIEQPFHEGSQSTRNESRRSALQSPLPAMGKLVRADFNWDHHFLQRLWHVPAFQYCKLYNVSENLCSSTPMTNISLSQELHCSTDVLLPLARLQAFLQDFSHSYRQGWSCHRNPCYWGRGKTISRARNWERPEDFPSKDVGFSVTTTLS